MPTPVINVAQMREWEKATWASGQTEAAVIARVGELVARRARQLTRLGQRVLILAGKGHNGDDARHAEKHLADRRVEVLNVAAPGEALPELERLLGLRPALVIDGLFGIGLNRPLDAKWVALIQRVNEARAQVLAVDVPSGLNVETGQPEGAAIEATVTLTVGAAKRGMLLPPALPFVGRLEVASEVGLAPCSFESDWQWILPEDFREFPPRRPATGHKGTFGRLAIVAGSLGYHGASVLASRGAQRAQPGLITLHTQANIYAVVASQLQAVMVSQWTPELELPGDYNAVLIGPGLASKNLDRSLEMATARVWKNSPVPVVVDASALDWLPEGPVEKGALRVVTPHPGEAARMLGSSVREVESDRPAAVRELSRRRGDCWVVLKGHQTLIGRSAGPIYVNSSGNAHLAQGGSGDVLGGYLAGLLAQKALQGEPGRTVCFGVWQHGATADELTATHPNWVVEDLVAAIGNSRGGVENVRASQARPDEKE